MVKKLDPLDEYHPQQTHRILKVARDAKFSAEEYAVYRYLIDMMWIAGGPVRNNARSLGADLNMTVRAWNRVLARLESRGLVIVTEDSISDLATMDAITAHAAFTTERSESGRRGGEAKARNRALQAEIDAQHQHRVHREKISSSPEANSRFAEPEPNEINNPPLAELQAQPVAQLLAIQNKEESYPEREEPEPAKASEAQGGVGGEPRSARWAAALAALEALKPKPKPTEPGGAPDPQLPLMSVVRAA